MRPTSRLRGCKSLSRIGAQYDVSLIDCTAPALWSSSLTKPGIQKRCFGGGARTRTLLQLHGDRTRQRSHSRQQHLGGQQKAGSLFGTSAHRTSSTLVVAPEVSEAVAAGEPVVALESTIYTHGAIGSDLDLPSVVRKHGAVPAVVGIVDGIAKVGVSDAELARMVAGNPVKVSRRDVARLVGMVCFL